MEGGELDAETVQEGTDSLGFFIRPETGKRSYNTDCVRCIFDCKQSFRAVLEACPRYVSRHSKAAKREELASAGRKKRR